MREIVVGANNNKGMSFAADCIDMTHVHVQLLYMYNSEGGIQILEIGVVFCSKKELFACKHIILNATKVVVRKWVMCAWKWGVV